VVFHNQMLLRVFDNHLGAQGMEGIGEIRNYLAPLLPQCGPSHVLVLIVANRVILFLYRIHKKNPKWDSLHILQTPLWKFYPNKFPTNV
jgi:hypothetical protein